MPISLQDLASLVQGQIIGDPGRTLHGARTLQEAGPEDISFVEGERGVRAARESAAGALVVPPTLADQFADRPVLVATDPLMAFVAIVRQMQGERPGPAPGVSPQAFVHPTARLGEGCSVLPFAYIGEDAVLGARCVVHPGVVLEADCRIGDDAVLHPNCVLKHGTVLGHRVIVHSGAVLGADGFGYRFRNGRHDKVPQLGRVEVGNDVEIGANTTIDRGTFMVTRLGDGTKIDNLVQIAHNCFVGRHNMICSQVGIAGSCTTGDYVVMGGQVGVTDHTTIGEGVFIGAQSGVIGDVQAGAKVLGYPAMPARTARRVLISMSSLPDLVKDVRRLKQQLGITETPGGQEEAPPARRVAG